MQTKNNIGLVDTSWITAANSNLIVVLVWTKQMNKYETSWFWMLETCLLSCSSFENYRQLISPTNVFKRFLWATLSDLRSSFNYFVDQQNVLLLLKMVWNVNIRHLPRSPLYQNLSLIGLLQGGRHISHALIIAVQDPNKYVAVRLFRFNHIFTRLSFEQKLQLQ